MLHAVGPAPGRLLDIGTGTGQLLELLAPRVERGLGVDASRAMLALARSRLSKPELAHCAVRQADMYRLPLPDGGFDTAVLADGAALRRGPGGRRRRGRARAAARRPPADRRPAAPSRVAELLDRLAHRWPGFHDGTIRALLQDAGLQPGDAVTVPGPAARPPLARDPARRRRRAALKELA